jgi:hypothetical protein
LIDKLILPAHYLPISVLNESYLVVSRDVIMLKGEKPAAVYILHRGGVTYPPTAYASVKDTSIHFWYMHRPDLEWVIGFGQIPLVRKRHFSA